MREDKPLSTAGALKLIRGLQPRFLTVNGDLLTTLDFGKLYDAHRKNGDDALVAVCERQRTIDFGVIELDEKDRLCAYTEKPSHRYLVSMGVNSFDRNVLSLIKPGESLGIPELIQRIKAANGTVRGFRNKAHWLDIGRPEDYETAQDLFTTPKGRARYLRS